MGLLISILIIILWASHLGYTLFVHEFSFTAVSSYIHILIQTYLYTGLFITAHDGMHGNISKQPKLNHLIGRLSSTLYACLSYKKLLSNHFAHHKHSGTSDDPDFSTGSQNFFLWWFRFMKKYSTVMQILCMALIYNILKLFVPEINVLLLWVVPAFLSSFQLFYFGTYKPHKTPHTHEMLPHNARSQKKNFIWGLLSCYFFGFHYEHHDSPRTPWWRLYNYKKV
jgi:beta-carotene/zeaxanthin 4-ketolase